MSTRDRFLAVIQHSPLWRSARRSEAEQKCASDLVPGLDIVWYFREYRDTGTRSLRVPLDSIEHYKQNSADLALSPSLAFDERWYRQVNPDVRGKIKTGEVVSGWEHYLQVGCIENRNPVWWFDEKWYQFKYPETKEAVRSGRLVSGFEHYLLYGIHKDFSPSLYFEAPWYRSLYLGAAPDEGSVLYPVVDYMMGDREARCPVRFFDTSWYRSLYMNGGALTGLPWRSPYEHYVLRGRFEGFSPSPLFDERAYRERNPQVADDLASGRYNSGFEHYINEGVWSGSIVTSHLNTGGTDFRSPAFLWTYEKSLCLHVRQLDLLRRLSQSNAYARETMASQSTT